jgi:hypothetical protein
MMMMKILTEKISKIIINITNEQYFKVPDFVKKNGLGIIEMVFVLLLATGGVVFSNNKNSKFQVLCRVGNSLLTEIYVLG